MIDLVFHEDDKFTIPDTSTADERVQLVQSYIGIFLTLKGSIELDPENGIEFELGKFNASTFPFLVQRLHNRIEAILVNQYQIDSLTVTDLEVEGESATFKVTIVKDDLVITTGLSL